MPAPPATGTLRVLDITKFYSPARGGVRTYLDAKMRHFLQREVSHALVVPGPKRGRHRSGNTTIYTVPGPPIPFTPGYRFLLSAGALEAIFREERPQVLEVGSPFLVPLITRRATRRGRIPTLGFFHADLVRTYLEPYAMGLPEPVRAWMADRTWQYVRSVYSRFDLTVAASPSVARELRDRGVPNVETVGLGVELDRFSPDRRTPVLRKRLGVPKTKSIALFAGRLCPEKGLDVVVDAHERMDAAHRPYLLLVGEGPSEKDLRRRASGRADFSVLPPLTDREEMAEVFASADIYVASGPGETFGLATAEALASGLPVVGVASGAVPDRVEGSGAGELYRRGDPASAAEALARMVGRLGSELTAAARAHAEKAYDWTRTFDTLLGFYEQLSRKGDGK